VSSDKVLVVKFSFSVIEDQKRYEQVVWLNKNYRYFVFIFDFTKL
jgi:hypothetical protein